MDELYSMWSDQSTGASIDYGEMKKFIENLGISDSFLSELETTLRLINHRKVRVLKTSLNNETGYTIELNGTQSKSGH